MLGIMEQLTHSTVKIVTTLHDGRLSSGTGFYMNLLNKEGECIPVIITNKHVIKDAKLGAFHVTLADGNDLPEQGKHHKFTIENFEKSCILHPNPSVDLAAYPIGPLLHKANHMGGKLFYVPLLTSLIPSDAERKEFSSMEDVVMIGYPSGIWDEVNNMPVIRKGITATHANTFWNGKPEFLTDIASFPGSSGSPVFLANIGGYSDKKGNTFVGQSRIRLIGIHYAGTQHTATGEIKIVTAPTSNIPISITSIPNNIGVAINSKEILVLEAELKKFIEAVNS